MIKWKYKQFAMISSVILTLFLTGCGKEQADVQESKPETTMETQGDTEELDTTEETQEEQEPSNEASDPIVSQSQILRQLQPRPLSRIHNRFQSLILNQPRNLNQNLLLSQHRSRRRLL